MNCLVWFDVRYRMVVDYPHIRVSYMSLERRDSEELIVSQMARCMLIFMKPKLCIALEMQLIQS